MAQESMEKLGEQPISARRIRRQVEAIGEARVSQREQQVESLKKMSFKERQCLVSVQPASLECACQGL
jgi:hypothetical protein